MHKLQLKNQQIFDLEKIQQRANLLKLKVLDPIDFFLDIENRKINKYVIYGFMRKKDKKKYYVFIIHVEEIIEFMIERIECMYLTLKEFNKTFKYSQCNMCYIGNSVENKIKTTILSFNDSLQKQNQKNKLEKLLLLLMIDYERKFLSPLEKKNIFKMLDDNHLLYYKNWLELPDPMKQIELNSIKKSVQTYQLEKNIYDLSTSSECIPFSQKNFQKICLKKQKNIYTLPDYFKKQLLHFCAISIAKNIDSYIDEAQQYIDLT